jgi:hypothetical protein
MGLRDLVQDHQLIRLYHQRAYSKHDILDLMGIPDYAVGGFDHFLSQFAVIAIADHEIPRMVKALIKQRNDLFPDLPHYLRIKQDRIVWIIDFV